MKIRSLFAFVLFTFFPIFSLTLPVSAQQVGGDRLVDVGGYKLHLKCSGQGSPEVIFESGLGGDADSWAKVMPAVSRTTRACSYDRANVGSSEPAPRPTVQIKGKTYLELRNGDEIVRDLHTVLRNAGEAGPYILIGHSLGGLYSILFAARYPKEVIGMVLEDSAHPDQLKKYGAISGPGQARIDHDSLIQNEEGIDIDAVFAEVKSLHWHTQIPLEVLSQGPSANAQDGESPEQWKEHQQAHREMQEEFTHMSTRSKWVIAEHSGHLIHRDQPEIVIKAIEDVLASARGASLPAR